MTIAQKYIRLVVDQAIVPKYIRKLERSIKLRFKKHVRNETFNVYRHIRDSGLAINRNNLWILHKSRERKKNNSICKVVREFGISKAASKVERLLNIYSDRD